MGHRRSVPENMVPARPTSRFILNHNAASKTLWDWLVMLATIYVAVTVPYNLSFMSFHDLTHAAQDTTICDIIVEIIFVMDIVLNFRTTYSDRSGRVIREARSIGIHYATTWFFVDVVAAFPFGLLYALNVPMTPWLQLMKMVRLLRFLCVLKHYTRSSPGMLAILISSFTLVAHWMACIWYAIGHKELEAKETWAIGWLYVLGDQLGTPYTNGAVGGPTTLDSYISALYFILSSLTSVGFGNIAPTTTAEKIFANCAMIVGALRYSLIGSITVIVQQMSSHHSPDQTQEKQLEDFTRVCRLPLHLKQRLQKRLQIKWSVKKDIDVNKYLRNLPADIHTDIAMHVYKDILQLPAFNGASPGCRRSLSRRMTTSLCVAEDYLVREGDAVHATYLVRSGHLQVVKDGMVIALLGEGAVIGAELPGTEQVISSNADVRALTYCEIHYISVRGLRKVLERHPRDARALASALQSHLTYNLREGRQPE